VNAARVARWVWGDGAAAKIARVPLIPLALAYGATMRLRAAAYERGLLPTERLPLPAVAIGNLSVGGTGKTPLAAWIARFYATRGCRPAVLLRGYGGDEPLVHRWCRKPWSSPIRTVAPGHGGLSRRAPGYYCSMTPSSCCGWRET